MSFKTMILGVAAAAAVALPGVASAQSYGGYGGGYRGQSHGYDQGYHGRYDARDDRHDRKRWEQRRRWEEKQRRREWQRAHRHGGYDRDYGRDDRGY